MEDSNRISIGFNIKGQEHDMDAEECAICEKNFSEHTEEMKMECAEKAIRRRLVGSQDWRAWCD
jgi:hypothetical protein